VDHLCRNWVLVDQAALARNVNGILGLLCKEHFPGLVRKGEDLEPAWTFDHYTLVTDASDLNGIRCRNKGRSGKSFLHYIPQFLAFIGHS
jgi:hypothetical protein